MKRLLPFFALIILMCGCSQNNGHIGPIHGAWTLVEMSCNGDALPIEGEATIFSFQGEIVQITHIYKSPDVYTKNFGNFNLEDKTLTFRFQTGESGSEGYQYTAPSWLHFPSDGLDISFEVTELGAKTMQWRRVTPDGGYYIYKFQKTW